MKIVGVVVAVGLLFVIYDHFKDSWLKKEKKLYQNFKGWFKNPERPVIIKALFCCLLCFLMIASYHYLLNLYNNQILIKLFRIEGLKIGEIGDSLAVLSFIALIISLMLTIVALKQQSEDLKATHIEMQANRKEAEEANELRGHSAKLQERSEVLENIRLLADNIDAVDEGIEKWKSNTVCEIVESNLSQLIESSLEVLVKIIRENEKGLLVDFAKDVITTNKKHLTGKSFVSSDLSKANLSKAILVKANLEKVNIYEACLSRANLSNAIMKGANMDKIDLFMAKLKEANMSKASLFNARLFGANLYKANLSDCALSEVDLSFANLLEADLSNTRILECNLSDSSLSYANLSGAFLFNVNLTRATLEKCNMEGSDLYDTNLSGSNLQSANLKGANLSNTNLSGANLKGTNLLLTNISEAKSLYQVKNLDPNIEKEIRDSDYGYLIDNKPNDDDE